ncbi:transposable element Tcb1 transposase [Trichonephila clavipes]|nr:transposable element Tcb1 transposase [Trichonephila clavipes]
MCDRWMQEGTTDRRGRSHPPQCTTSREYRQIVRMAVTDRSVTSPTVSQYIESVTHHSVSARIIRRHLQQTSVSARRPLLGLPLTQNHRRLHRQWCDERRMWVAEWNEVVFTDESRICLQPHDGRIRVWRHRAERMLNSLCTTTLVLHRVLWYGVVLDITLALLQYALPIELLPWLARSPDLSPIESIWSMVAQRLTQNTPPAATPDQLWQRVEAACSTVPQEHIQSLFESMCGSGAKDEDWGCYDHPYIAPTRIISVVFLYDHPSWAREKIIHTCSTEYITVLKLDPQTQDEILQLLKDGCLNSVNNTAFKNQKRHFSIVVLSKLQKEIKFDSQSKAPVEKCEQKEVLKEKEEEKRSGKEL